VSDTDGPRREAHRDLTGPIPEPVSERKQIDRQVLTAVVKGTTDIVFSDITGDRDRGYDPFALANAYACRVAHPDIDSDLQLHLFLKRHEDELPEAGVRRRQGVPSRGALARFRDRVNDGTLHRIEHGYMGVQQEILVNFDRYDPDEYVTTYAQSDEVSEQQLRQAYEKIKPELDTAIPDGRDGDKTSFEWERFRDILAESMLQRESASQILRNRRRPQKPEDVEPVPVQHCDPDEREMRIRTFFDGFEKHSATSYMKGFEGVFEQLIRRAKRNGLYDRPVDVHIDGTDFIYTPQSRDENGQKKIAEGAVGTKGGEYAYKFLTVSIEDRQSGRSMKPVVFPMRDRSLLFRRSRTSSAGWTSS